MENILTSLARLASGIFKKEKNTSVDLVDSTRPCGTCGKISSEFHAWDSTLEQWGFPVEQGESPVEQGESPVEQGESPVEQKSISELASDLGLNPKSGVDPSIVDAVANQNWKSVGGFPSFTIDNLIRMQKRANATLDELMQRYVEESGKKEETKELESIPEDTTADIWDKLIDVAEEEKEKEETKVESKEEF